MIPQEQPIPLLALCDAATKAAHEGQPVWGAGRDEYNARLSPEVVRAVYEALRDAWPFPTWPAPEDGCCTTDEDRIAQQQWGERFNAMDERVKRAIALLDGHNLNTEKKP